MRPRAGSAGSKCIVHVYVCNVTLGWSHCEMVADTFVGYGPPWRQCLAAGQPAESLVITFDRSFEVLG